MRLSSILNLNPRNVFYILRNVRLNSALMKSHVFFEVLVRSVLLLVFCYTETLEPFHRPIPPEQLWHYKYPHHDNTLSTPLLFVVSTGIPASFILAYYIFNRDITDLIQGLLGLALSFAINGVIVNIIKLSVGRPRPDFYYRCFLNGEVTPDLQCNGDPDVITDGRKSFPSGHTAWMFVGFGYLSLYLAGKLQCFSQEGKSQSWRLIAVLTPLVSATVVGLSRIQDNMHHWEDVAVGGFLGFIIAVLCYHHHYPLIFQANALFPYPLRGSQDPSLPLTNSVLMMTPSRNQLPHISSKAQLTEVKTL